MNINVPRILDVSPLLQVGNSFGSMFGSMEECPYDFKKMIPHTLILKFTRFYATTNIRSLRIPRRAVFPFACFSPERSPPRGLPERNIRLKNLFSQSWMG